MLFPEKNTKKDTVFIILVSVLTIALFLIPSQFKDRNLKNTMRARAKVISTDNSELEQYGIVKTGNQGVELEILNGKFKGLRTDSNNMLMGKLELDKMFMAGDKALVVISLDENGEFVYANVIDHYRIRVELVLLILFAGLLILFAGLTGAKALLSFIFTGVAIWKILLPGFLKGINPIFLSLLIVSILSAVIIFLVGGLSKKGVVAFLGTISGIIMTAVLSGLFGKLFHIHGAVKPFSETLLYSGYSHLNLSAIFISGIFIASSGAVMDIGMDISASMSEIIHKKPDISFKELTVSGIKVGRAVVGTMTTTLLLAYSGSYSTVLMVMIAQGTPIANVLNLTYISAEILHTLTGSFGLVLTAPLTALIGGMIYKNFHLKNR